MPNPTPPRHSFSVFMIGVLVLISCERGLSDDVTWSTADRLIESALEDSLFTGAVFLVGTPQAILFQKAYGHASLYDKDRNVLEHPEHMSSDHLFDLASLTKIFATTYGFMILHSEGKIDVDDPVHEYLPAFDTPEKRKVTLRHLLSHSSGLMQWFPTYFVASGVEERLTFTAETPLQWPPGRERRYSDLGFMVLGDVIEAISGQPLDLFVQEKICEPLGLTSTHFNPDTGYHANITSTSHGNPFEKKMVEDPDFGYRVNVDADSWDEWRTTTLRGEVNDGNAFYTQRGVAGHAGLFSTVPELYRMLTAMLNGGTVDGVQLFNPETIDLFTTKDHFENGLGWMMDPAILNARKLSAGSYGHTGFTGTNILVSPEDDLILILLTNRQHVGVDERGVYPDLRELREELAALFFSEEEKG